MTELTEEQLEAVGRVVCERNMLGEWLCTGINESGQVLTVSQTDKLWILPIDESDARAILAELEAAQAAGE